VATRAGALVRAGAAIILLLLPQSLSTARSMGVRPV
jgi:hypothetical protein